MATYKKKLKTLVVHLMLDGEPVNIADTADDDAATRALNEFKRYETMHYEANGITNGIPYHAVQYIEVTETEADVEKADPYGCDGGGTDTYTIETMCSDYTAQIRIGENLPSELFTCTPCGDGSYYVVGDTETGDYQRVDSTTVLTDDMTRYARDGKIIVEYLCY